MFQYRPGPQRTATLTFTNNDVIWEPESANRAGSLFNGDDRHDVDVAASICSTTATSTAKGCGCST